MPSQVSRRSRRGAVAIVIDDGVLNNSYSTIDEITAQMERRFGPARGQSSGIKDGVVNDFTSERTIQIDAVV